MLHADRIRKLENIRIGWAMLRDQHLFVQWANDLEWKSFTRTCAYWLLVNDQDGPQPEDHDVANTCHVRVQADGRVTLKADLDPALGAIVCQQLGDETNALFNEENEHGHPRTVGQRQAAPRRPPTTPHQAGPNKPGQPRPRVRARQQIQNRRPTPPQTRARLAA